MANPRPSAWALISVLVATFMMSPAAVSTVSAAPDRSVCQPEFRDFVWANDLKPPPYVFVLRNGGPEGIAGHVTKVPFWDYVGVVVRTEYSGSGLRGANWHRMGALAVKQYAWYYVNLWRGGKVAFTTTNPDGTTTTTYECYHVKDTTADQLYKPIKFDPRINAWVPQNQPTVNNLAGMRETWHMSLRKWKADKNKSFMFLSGYRSGNAVPCGTDATGFRIYQASLRDCGEGAKNLTFEESVRRYFRPVYLLNTRDHDILGDDGNFRGDLGVLAPAAGGATQARVYPGNPTDKFGTATSRTFSIPFESIIGQGTGNVHAPRFETQGTGLVEANPTAMFADLFMLTADKLWLARSTGNGLADPTSRNVSATGLAVDDFNGDMLADAGLLGPNGLRVLRSLGDGSFAAEPAAWWSGDLAARTYVGVGDFNGDGKADMVVRNADNSYHTALSRATCTNYSTRGLCPSDATGAPGLSDLASAGQTTPWAVTDVKHVVGDFDRDGLDDLVAVTKDGANIKIMGMRSRGDGTFDNAQNLGAFSIAFSDFAPVAMDVSPDSMTDVALVGADRIVWLRTNERGVLGPASMTAMPRRDLTGGATLIAGGFKPF